MALSKYPLQNAGFAVIIGTPLLAACFVGLRIFSRRKFATYLGWDDYTIIFANILSIALTYPSVKFIKMWHFGIHIWNVSRPHLEPDYDEFHAVLLSFNLLNTLILPLVKASIIILLMRVSSVLPIIRRSLYTVFAFNLLACLIPFIILIFQCPPQTGNTWKPRVFGNLHCMNRPRIGQMQIFQTSANFLTDLLVLPIPFILMRKLERTSVRTRIIIIFLFMLSLGVTAIGAAKIYLTYQDRLYNIQANDWTYNIVFCINHAENNVAIIVACIPALRGLIMRWISNPSPTDEENQRLRRNWPTSPQARDIATFSFRASTASSPKAKAKFFSRLKTTPPSRSLDVQKRYTGALPSSHAQPRSLASSKPVPSFSSGGDTVIGDVMSITKTTEIESFSELGVLGRERSFSSGGGSVTEIYASTSGPSFPSSPVAVERSAARGMDEMEFITVKSGIL